ncbi:MULTISPECIES: carbohydrate ABC transporter permease [Cohnella]|uniref:Putative aldouronate transport system permease protein n=1 Tax=Cohnella phaseoli TaxID=456490 RepID=A0A3D9KID5_9BACL|nr:carbohydrate ABC transporter permease [Cohnella phaseoli]RED85267.1 putative aldouronate transport system permease protein [Cohnella phaseoli]
MVERTSWGRRLFVVLNYVFLTALSLTCLLPILHVLAISFSSSAMASAGEVVLWPVDFTLKSYEYVLGKEAFVQSILVTLQRVALGVTLNMLLTIVIAYPLSKEVQGFRYRTWYAWFFVFTILFSGGIIPWYFTINETGLIDTIWALILPGAVPVFNVILLLNFFRGLPKELEEAAFIDGAGHLQILFRLFVPLSKPALATILLFTVVGHWNSWFDGLVLMNRPEHYPLQSYLQTVVIMQDLSSMTLEDAKMLSEISDRTTKAAQIFLAAFPVLLVYPFLQKYFVKGIVLGSVKG